jgi:archaellum component FlaC
VTCYDGSNIITHFDVINHHIDVRAEYVQFMIFTEAQKTNKVIYDWHLQNLNHLSTRFDEVKDRLDNLAVGNGRTSGEVNSCHEKIDRLLDTINATIAKPVADVVEANSDLRDMVGVLKDKTEALEEKLERVMSMMENVASTCSSFTSPTGTASSLTSLMGAGTSSAIRPATTVATSPRQNYEYNIRQPMYANWQPTAYFAPRMSNVAAPAVGVQMPVLSYSVGDYNNNVASHTNNSNVNNRYSPHVRTQPPHQQHQWAFMSDPHPPTTIHEKRNTLEAHRGSVDCGSLNSGNLADNPINDTTPVCHEGYNRVLYAADWSHGDCHSHEQHGVHNGVECGGHSSHGGRDRQDGHGQGGNDEHGNESPNGNRGRGKK